MAIDRQSYELQLKLVTGFVNDLCYAAGDESHDLSFYRRRAALFGLYTQFGVFNQRARNLTYFEAY